VTHLRAEPAGYDVKFERVIVTGVAALTIRSLLDGQQFDDPLGVAAALGISSAQWSLFGLLWPSGHHLAAAMARRPLRGAERILEIGCGLALASLVLHRRGAFVTASDSHPLAAAFLRENLRLNGLPPLPFVGGIWADAEGSHGFETIIGSDVLYERDEAGLLPRFIAGHAAPASEILIIDPNRGNRAPFQRRMVALGYRVDEITIRDPLGPGGPYSGRLMHFARAAA
jgi:predicted nicotinamide N-methyase